MTCLCPARWTLNGNIISTTINITAINQPVSIMLPPASQTRRAGSPPGAIRAEAEAKATAGCSDEQAAGRRRRTRVDHLPPHLGQGAPRRAAPAEYASPPAKRVTTGSTRASRRGSMAESRPPVSPSGLATAWPSCPRSTPSASTTRTTWLGRRIEGALPGRGESEEDTAHEPEADLSGGLPRPAASR